MSDFFCSFFVVFRLLFEGFENLATKEEEKRQVTAHTRKKSNRNGQDKITLPEDLPVKTTILDIPEEDKVCKETGQPLVQIGVEISHKLAHEPGSYYIKEIIRPKYVHPKREEAGVMTAELPECLLSKCRADESLLAEIITKKFADHLPLYRIAEGMARERIKISRKLLSQWVVKCGMALKPLHEEMRKHILQSRNIFIDESPVRPLAIGRKNWLFFGSVDGGEAGAILFSLVQTCRGLGINPREYLEDIMRRIMGHCHQQLHELLPDHWRHIRTQNTNS